MRQLLKIIFCGILLVSVVTLLLCLWTISKYVDDSDAHAETSLNDMTVGEQRIYHSDEIRGSIFFPWRRNVRMTIHPAAVAVSLIHGCKRNVSNRHVATKEPLKMYSLASGETRSTHYWLIDGSRLSVRLSSVFSNGINAAEKLKLAQLHVTDSNEHILALGQIAEANRDNRYENTFVQSLQFVAPSDGEYTVAVHNSAIRKQDYIQFTSLNRTTLCNTYVEKLECSEVPNETIHLSACSPWWEHQGNLPYTLVTCDVHLDPNDCILVQVPSSSTETFGEHVKVSVAIHRITSYALHYS